MSDTSTALATVLSVFIPALATAAAYATQLRSRLTAAEYAATHDELTDLANRRALTTALRAATSGPGRFSMVIVDVDGFKHINDTYGHLAGDTVLREIGRRLHTADPRIRLAARLGGDEFALLVDGVDLTVAKAVWKAIAFTPVTLGTTHIQVYASVGAATHLPGTPIATLMQQADLALYQAKAAGAVYGYPAGQPTPPINQRPARRVRDHHPRRTDGLPTPPVMAQPARPDVNRPAPGYRCWFDLSLALRLAEHAHTSRHHMRSTVEEHLVRDCPGALELIIDSGQAILTSSGFPALLRDPHDPNSLVAVPAHTTEGITQPGGLHHTPAAASIEHLHLTDELLHGLRAGASHGGFLVIDVNNQHVTAGITHTPPPGRG